MNDVVDLVRFSRTRADLERFALKNPSYDPSELLERLERENDVKQAKTCAYVLCSEPFVAERKDTIYCSDKCKVGAYRLRKHGYESTELSEVLSRAHEAELQWHGVGGASSDALKAKRRREDALRAAYDAIAAELGIVQASPVDEPENEPENDAEQDPLDADILREKLRAFRDETGFSQAKIAKLVGSNQPTISQFQNGKIVPAEHVRRAILDLISQDHGMDRR